MSWHADAELIERFARGEIDEPQAFSLEAHVLACARCRAALAPHMARERHERVWEAVRERVDAPARTPLEALLVRAGVRDDVARLLAATPSLTLGWLAAVALSLAFAVAAAHAGGRGLQLFLTLAPLLPLSGVAAAYGRGLDPIYEIGLAAPAGGFRLLLVRAVAVFAVTSALAGVAALALPRLDAEAAAWLVPALALSACSLALGTFVAHIVAFAGSAIAWVAAVLFAEAMTADRLAAFHTTGQVTCAVVAAVAVAVIAARRSSFERWSGA